MKPIPLPELASHPEPRFVEFAKAIGRTADVPERAHTDTLPALVYRSGLVMTEWALSEEELARLGRGERVRLWIQTYGRAIHPVALEVTSEDHP
jgi:hypothetical protein